LYLKNAEGDATRRHQRNREAGELTSDDPNRRGQSRRFEDELLRWHAAGSGEQLSVVDSSGDLSYVSRAAERLLGWSPEELLGKPATSL